MKLYSLNSKLDFGDYKGKTLQEVFAKDPEYIEECILENTNFCFNPSVVEALEDSHPEFAFSEEAVNKLDEKFEIYEDQENDFEDAEEFDPDDLKNLGIPDEMDDDFDDFDEGEGYYDDGFNF